MHQYLSIVFWIFKQLVLFKYKFSSHANRVIGKLRIQRAYPENINVFGRGNKFVRSHLSKCILPRNWIPIITYLAGLLERLRWTKYGRKALQCVRYSRIYTVQVLVYWNLCSLCHYRYLQLRNMLEELNIDISSLRYDIVIVVSSKIMCASKRSISIWK